MGVFERLPNNLLRPVDPAAERLVASMKTGKGVMLSGKKTNNVAFHRKLFALLNLAFETWEPEGKTYRGNQMQKNFESFRKEIIVLAGFYDAYYSVSGEVRFDPHSLSFKECEDDKRGLVYKAILGVVWDRILRHANYLSEAEVDRVVNKLLAFE
jgi:hypothetical protein